MVLLRLQQLGRGLWTTAVGHVKRGTTKRLMGVPPTLELWSSKITRGGRIVFEVRVAPPCSTTEARAGGGGGVAV